MADPVRARVVMLLQGPRSPFFARLADALAARGARVERVLFCPGDELYWLGRRARRFRGGLADWPGWLTRALAETGATDVVGLGDGRPLHAAGFAAARAAGALVHVVEQGFLRPGWLTLEPDALGAWRPDPAALAAAERLPDPPAPRFRASFAAFAAMDAAYDLANLAAAWALYPGYRRHELGHPLAGWAGWLRKAATLPGRRRAARAALAAIEEAAGPVFLFALQLETDFMIRRAGPADGLRGALARVSASFARAAPPGALLVVKPHPLDPGLTPWRALALGGPAGARTIVLDGGDLDALAPRLAGLVTVNSTAGLAALRRGTPVTTLGQALYDRPGLTHQRGLDAFWTAPDRPDPRQVGPFVRALAAAIQTPGGFDGEGVKAGAEGVARLILARRPGAARAAA